MVNPLPADHLGEIHHELELVLRICKNGNTSAKNLRLIIMIKLD